MSTVLIKAITSGLFMLSLSHVALAQDAHDEHLGSGSARLANQAYESYEKRNYVDADSMAALALKLRPGNTKLWLLRIYSLQKLGRQDAALAIAEDAVKANQNSIELLKVRDLLRSDRNLTTAATQGKTNAATPSAAAATVDSAPVTHADTASAPATIGSIAPPAAAVHQQANAAVAAVSPPASASATVSMPAPVSTPAVVSAPASVAASSGVTAPPSKQELAWRNADAAYKHYANGDFANAQKYARRSLQLRPDQPKMKRLLGYAADRQNALQRIDTTKAQPGPSVHSPSPPPGYEPATKAYAAWDRHDYAASSQYGKIAVEEAPDNTAYRLLYINSLTLTDQYRAAYEQFSQLAARPVPDSNLLDAAYTAQRFGANKQAIEWFSNAIDAADACRMDIDSVTRENVRQTISDLDRRWGFSSGISYGSVGVMDPAFAPSLNRRKTLQTSSELYWRSPWTGGGGRHLEWYVRGNMTQYDGTHGATGLSTLQSAAGVRLKPFSTQNVVLAAEHLFKTSSDSRDDWLLRAAWSDGEGANLPAGKNATRYWQLYAEADYFIKHPQALGAAEGRYGQNYRITSVSPNLSVAPHLTMFAGYDSLLAKRATLGAGAGVNIRYRFRQDTYHAPQSYVDFTVQYRVRVAGDDRAKGVFASLYFAY